MSLPRLPKLPKLCELENVEDPMLCVKLISPRTGWEWYIAAYDEQKKIFYGLVAGWETEVGYFSLHELEDIDDFIRIDYKFKPQPLSKVKKTLVGGK